MVITNLKLEVCALMLVGTVYNSIDDKCRMIVPSKMRGDLGTRCILTKGLDRCLYIYPMEEWERQMEKIGQLPKSDPKVRAFIRHYYGNACECEFDKQGRIGIPQELKAYAGIDKELVTMGAMDKIEIWSRESWDSPDNDCRMDQEDFSDALREYNF